MIKLRPDIAVPWTAELDSWLGLLYTLHEEATGLRVVELEWVADFEFPWQL
jgi:hypothetical protein